jgi:hypothetical protein
MYDQIRGRHHVIEVVLKSVNQDTSTTTTQSQTNPVNNKSVSTKVNIKLGKFAGKLYLAKLAINTAKTLVVEMPLSTLQRVGSYTGNDIAQTDINNTLDTIQSGISFAKGMITNPVGTAWNAILKRQDYLLSVQKQNDSIDYLKKTLLLNVNKGGTKL